MQLRNVTSTMWFQMYCVVVGFLKFQPSTSRIIKVFDIPLISTLRKVNIRTSGLQFMDILMYRYYFRTLCSLAFMQEKRADKR